MGTRRTRPSVKATRIIISSNSTELARAVVGTYDRRVLSSGLLLAEVLIPNFQKIVAMLINEPFDRVEFAQH